MTERRTHSRRLRNLVVDRGFQVRTTLAFVLTCLALASVFAGLLYREVRIASRVEATGVAEFDAALHEHLADDDRRVAWRIVGALFVLGVLMTGACLVWTHRMAGPLFVLRRFMGELAHGRWPPARALRPHDEFHGVISDFHGLVAALRARHDRLAARLEDLAADDRAEPIREGLLEVARDLRGEPSTRAGGAATPSQAEAAASP